MGSKIYPSTLVRLMDSRGLKPGAPVAIDTETSGLWVDAGARVSTVSVGWIVADEDVAEWAGVLGGASDEDQYLWDTGIWTLRKEVTHGARSSEWAHGDWLGREWVLSFAWPFDQGAMGTGKPEDRTDEIIAEGQKGLLEGIWVPDPPQPDSANLPRSEWSQLCSWLRSVGEDVGLTMHNAKFDIHMMRAGVRGYDWAGVDLIDLVTWDTQGGADIWVGWRTADSGRSTTSLKPNSSWLWGEHEGDEKKVISAYLKKHKLPAGRWDLMPWRVIAQYADQDARLTCRYRRWQEVEQKRVYSCRADKTLAEYGWTTGWSKESFERRMETMRMLTRVERRGLPFDGSLARDVGRRLQERIDEVEAKLEAALGTVTLPVAKHYWFGSGDKLVGEKGSKRDVRGLGLADYGKTEKGEPIVDQATLAKMHRDGYPLVEEWMAYKKLTDAKSRWYDGWTDRMGRDGRLRTGFRQNGTASGRFSVEEIQLQAIPADYKVKGGPLAGLETPRDLIGAGVPEGYALWEMDLAQAELRVAADMAGCRRMLDMIEAGEDLHGYTARELFDVTPDSEDWGEKRQVAKRGNFSLIFGVGWETFSATLWKEAGVDWGEQETRQMIAAWNALYPEYKAAIRSHEAVVMRRYDKYGVGWIADRATGERRWFTKWDIEYFNPRTQRLEKGAHKAFNQRVQPALAQYGIDRWLGEERYLTERAKREGWDDGAGLVLMVHDSSVLLLPDEVGEEVTSDLKAMGEKLWAERFPGLPGGLDISRWDDHA
ncbi:DNA polymerase I [Microbacterium phage Theresita]|nr:DNA polymerase I [Microbacterium phage Theresita]